MIYALIFYGTIGFSQDKQTDSLSLLRDINESFKVLDSLDSINNGDTIALIGVYYINFMAKVTGISPTAEGTFMGYLYCTKSDLQKWHNWYDKRYSKKID